MDYQNSLNLESKLAERMAGSADHSDHSVLAMRAAKRMRRTKHKAKTGHAICHHLLEMIKESTEAQPAPRIAQRYHGLREGLRHGVLTDIPNSRLSNKVPDGTDLNSANDRQFSLAF